MRHAVGENARRSTGPKTANGIARVGLNALKHGLSVPITADVDALKEIHQLAATIVGEKDSDECFEQATIIVETQLDIARIRQARVALWQYIFDNQAREESGVSSVGESDASSDHRPSESLERLLTHMDKLDRYERRALSRRKKAIREFSQNSDGTAIAR